MVILVPLSCPKCGGTLNPEKSKEIIRCEYCRSFILVSYDDGKRSIKFLKKNAAIEQLKNKILISEFSLRKTNIEIDSLKFEIQSLIDNKRYWKKKGIINKQERVDLKDKGIEMLARLGEKANQLKKSLTGLEEDLEGFIREDVTPAVKERGNDG